MEDQKYCCFCGCGYSKLPDELTVTEIKIAMVRLDIRPKDLTIAMDVVPSSITGAMNGNKFSALRKRIGSYLINKLREENDISLTIT
jgi:hypothetical protein